MQVSNSMGYSQRWRQFNKTTRKDPKSLNLCSLVQVSMQFMQLGLHLSCLCKQFSLFASMNLPCLCVWAVAVQTWCSSAWFVLSHVCTWLLLCWSKHEQLLTFGMTVPPVCVHLTVGAHLSFFHHSLFHFTSAAVLSSLYVWKVVFSQRLYISFFKNL